jgi:LPXTG-motif cell wall-anchored protein
VKKISAVVMTAALVLSAVATSAAAEDEKITVDGLVWLDHDQNTKHDPAEPVLGNWRGVQVKKADTDEVVGEFPTDADGRYRAELPAGRYIVTVLANGEYSTTNGMTRLVGSTATFDFGLRGASITGRSFADRNRDGLRQPDEELLSPGTLNGKPVPMPREDGQFSVEDLPYGKYKFVPADYTSHRLVLAEPNGTFEFTLGELEGPSPLDVRYVKPKGDLAITVPVVSPAKDVYVVGDEVDVAFQIVNKGELPEMPTFTTGMWSLTTLGHSDNVEPTPGSYDQFAVKSPLPPGQSLDVRIRARFTTTEPVSVNVLVRPSRWGDDNFKDNVQIKPIKVVEKGAETTTPPASTTTTAAPTTTTTAVAKAGTRSGLASTGASPLGFIALGSLLLAAGLGVFFVARRRRS